MRSLTLILEGVVMVFVISIIIAVVAFSSGAGLPGNGAN